MHNTNLISMLAIVLLVLIIAAIGIIAAFSDIKENRIRNKIIIAGLILGISLKIILFEKIVLIELLINMILIGIIGFIFWKLDYLGAGDAKLLVAFTALLPPQDYIFRTTRFLAPLDILINAIIPLAIIIAVEAILKADKAGFKMAIFETFNPKRLGITLLFIFSFSWLIRYLLLYLGIVPDYLMSIFAILCSFVLLEKILDKYEILGILVLISILHIFLNKEYILSIEFLESFFLYTCPVVMLMIFIVAMARDKFGTNVEYGTTRVRFGKDDVEIAVSEERLAKKHIPFAPALFFGVLATIICDGNVIVFIRNMLW